MRYAVFSDVHANLIAWQAVRRDMAHRGTDVLVCLGDVVGYGPRPMEVLESILEVTSNILGTEHRIIFLGHTHIPKVFEWDGAGDVLEFAAESQFLDPGKRYIVNVGSVGEPRDPADLRARYVIYDTERALLEFHAVDFDISACRDDLESTNLGLMPFFLMAFEENAELAREDLSEEAPAGRLMRPAGTSAVSRVQLVSPDDHFATVVPRKRNGIAMTSAVTGLLLLAGGVFWFSVIRPRGNENTAKAEAKGAPTAAVTAPKENSMSAAGTGLDISLADLGEDLWQTITYTDCGDDLRLHITGLLPEIRYLVQVSSANLGTTGRPFMKTA